MCTFVECSYARGLQKWMTLNIWFRWREKLGLNDQDYLISRRGLLAEPGAGRRIQIVWNVQLLVNALREYQRQIAFRVLEQYISKVFIDRLSRKWTYFE